MGVYYGVPSYHGQGASLLDVDISCSSPANMPHGPLTRIFVTWVISRREVLCPELEIWVQT
jgi:hypothetical protein